MCGVCYPNPGAPLHPGMFIFVSLRQCSSHLLLSASTRFIVRVLSACVICTLPHLGILWFIRRVFVFFVALISGGVFFCCALVPGTLALDLPTLILERGLVFFYVSLSVTTEFVSLYDEESGRTLGVLLMSSDSETEKNQTSLKNQGRQIKC